MAYGLRPYLVGLFAAALWSLLGPVAHAQPTISLDVTGALRQYTTIDVDIDAVCDRACLGNQRRGSLVQAMLHIRQQPALSLVVATIRLRSRQAMFGGRTVLFDRSAELTITFDVDMEKCTMSNPRISSGNDLYRILVQIFERQAKRAASQFAMRC